MGPSSAKEDVLYQDDFLTQKRFVSRPLQVVAEMGRRFTAYGAWILSIVGDGFFDPRTALLAGLFVVTGLGFLLGGFALLYLVPLVPLVRFLAAVVSWGASVFFAVITLPLVALAHLYPAGDGLVGPLARRAYWMWLGLFMRPVVILFSFGCGFILFIVGAMLMNLLFLDWIGPFVESQSDAFWGLRSVLSLFNAFFLLALSNIAFRTVHFEPLRLLDWVDVRAGSGEGGAVATDNQQGRGPIVDRLETFFSSLSQHRESSDKTSSSSRKVALSPSKTGSERAEVAKHFPVYRDRDSGASATATAQASAQTAGGGVLAAGAKAAAQGGKAAAVADVRGGDVAHRAPELMSTQDAAEKELHDKLEKEDGQKDRE
jgi:hypothetical protein